MTDPPAFIAYLTRALRRAQGRLNKAFRDRRALTQGDACRVAQAEGEVQALRRALRQARRFTTTKGVIP